MSYGVQIDDIRAEAEDLFKAGDYSGAVERYRKLLEAVPASTPALKGLGLALVKSGQVAEGIEALSKAAVLQPTDAEIRYSYGYALGSAQRFGEAANELDAALSLQPGHVAAKQALVYSLMTHAQGLIKNGQATEAEPFLDRAHKIDVHNATISASLLDLYHGTGQKGKAINLYKGLDDATKTHAAMQPVLAKLNADDGYQAALKQTAYSSAPAVAKPAAPAGPKHVPCPQCRLPIMDFAAVCPHCNFKIRAIGTFADIDRGPNVIWQDVAYMIFAALWTLSAGWDVYQGLQRQSYLGTGILIFSSLRLMVGIGLLFKMESLAFIGKIFCYISIIFSFYMMFMAAGLGLWLIAAIYLTQLSITSFFVYLINYVVGD